MNTENELDSRPGEPGTTTAGVTQEPSKARPRFPTNREVDKAAAALAEKVGEKIVEREVTITGIGGRSRTTTGNSGGTGGFPTGGNGGFPTGGSGGSPTGGFTRG